jgi:DNA-directed RNA polymerase specialized sigma24 family protein
MDNLRLETALRHVHKLVGARRPDGELLERFVCHRDEAAFELLVCRYAPLVWGVCRRVLGNAHDADDAFQATLLVLVRKAASIDRRASVAGWLYRVASRVAVRARASQARRQLRVCSAGTLVEIAAEPVPGDADLRCVLDGSPATPRLLCRNARGNRRRAGSGRRRPALCAG